MRKIIDFIVAKRKYFYLIIAILILVFIVSFFSNSNDSTDETITIKRSVFVNQVSVSGKVEAVSAAELGFAASGRIAKIFVKNNDDVVQGQVLAQLEIDDLLADLKIKELNSKTSDVDFEDARYKLENVTKQENTKVDNAYQTLLTEGLELIPNSNDYGVEPPTLGGIYHGLEGQYKISIDKENVTSSEFRLLTFNLEKTRRVVNKEGPTLLGTKGLYISFPVDPDLSSYQDTTWFLNIPNKASSSYGANLNAYNEAKNDRDLAIKNAELAFQKIFTQDDGGDSVALAEIQKIKADIKKNTIHAPFSGKITNIAKEVGEVASINESLITIISTGIFEIESYVPEVNIAVINLDDEAKVTLDAYGEDVFFDAKVISIDQAETLKDGVSTYRIKLLFDEADERIKSGMTANVSIIIFNKPDVIVVPGGVVFEQDGKKFVQIKNEKEIINREVTLGDVSSLGQVEVVSGLEEGDAVVINPLLPPVE